MISQKFVKLFTGVSMPQFGLGTWQSAKGEVGKAVKIALNAGYRHIDCAAIYGNEEEVGEAIGEELTKNTIKRENLWVTSKLWNTEQKPEKVRPACEKTLKDLNLDYLDLYLLHWPLAFDSYEFGETPVFDETTSIKETWAEMEKLVEDGLVKHIGVSNFTPQVIDQILSFCNIQPAVNQVENHPLLPQNDLLKFCKEKDIAVTAYSPLGNGVIEKMAHFDALLGMPQTVEVAETHDTSPAAVCLAWNLKRGVIVIPKSVTPSRIQDNIKALELELTDDDMDTLDKLPHPRRLLRSESFFVKDVFDADFRMKC